MTKELFPLTYTVKEAVRVSGLGRTTIYEAINSGELVSSFPCGRRLIAAWSLRALIGVPAPGDIELKRAYELMRASEEQVRQPRPRREPSHSLAPADRARPAGEMSTPIDRSRSLLRVVLALAREHYEYDPQEKRQQAAARIRDVTERQGIRVDDDTIRAILRDAAASCSKDV